MTETVSGAGHRPHLVIAIDGPAASGKGTLAKRIAAHYGFARLDSGRLYRAAAKRLHDAGGSAEDMEAAARAALGVRAEDLADPALDADSVAKTASRIAAYGDVRKALLAFQRRFARTPPGGAPGAVIDGRDIGTVVCPDADVKFFVTASLEVRAARRLKELREKGLDSIKARVLQDMRERDARDQSRDESPLKQAGDAHLLDTTGLNADEAFEAARTVIDEAAAVK
ncbi:MAG: (d)CMP kinase [Alphaproteobacteria bacterium]|nr:(d)CMP kinase [Alphaproteobacteria bacterium]